MQEQMGNEWEDMTQRKDQNKMIEIKKNTNRNKNAFHKLSRTPVV